MRALVMTSVVLRRVRNCLRSIIIIIRWVNCRPKVADGMCGPVGNICGPVFVDQKRMSETWLIIKGVLV